MTRISRFDTTLNLVITLPALGILTLMGSQLLQRLA